eukprot:g3439.t1
MDARQLTTLLVYFASIVEKADEQVLPSVYFFAGRSWGASPTQLGQITLCRALVQALSSPISGFLGDRYDRISVIAIGCLIWGIMTSAIAIANSINQAMFFAAINGFGLSLVIPCCQSIIADFYPPTSRGRAFGIMQLIAAIGVVAGGMFATNVGHVSPLGIDGWRLALHIVAGVSLITGVLIKKLGKDPRHCARKPADLEASRGPRGAPFSWEGVWRILSIPSFGIIILQGVIGMLPWNAMVFFTLWFQLLGFTDFVASSLLATFHAGCALGGIVGGFVADTLASNYPDSGRIIAAQISAFSGAPFFFVLFKVLPLLPVAWRWLPFGVLLLVMGSMISWNGNCCNAPMMSEIVPQSLYSRIFAFDRSLEGAIASTAAPLVGYIAEHYFGFTGSIGKNPNLHPENAGALGNSLFLCIVIPMSLCAATYTGLYWTFPKDRRLAKTHEDAT